MARLRVVLACFLMLLVPVQGFATAFKLCCDHGHAAVPASGPLASSANPFWMHHVEDASQHRSAAKAVLHAPVQSAAVPADVRCTTLCHSWGAITASAHPHGESRRMWQAGSRDLTAASRFVPVPDKPPRL